MKTSDAPWQVGRCKADFCSDADCRLWQVSSPRGESYFFDAHAEALAFVLAQPEVRRRTSSAALAGRQAAEALS